MGCFFFRLFLVLSLTLSAVSGQNNAPPVNRGPEPHSTPVESGQRRADDSSQAISVVPRTAWRFSFAILREVQPRRA